MMYPEYFSNKKVFVGFWMLDWLTDNGKLFEWFSIDDGNENISFGKKQKKMKNVFENENISQGKTKRSNVFFAMRISAEQTDKWFSECNVKIILNQIWCI